MTKSVFLLLLLAALCQAQGVGEDCDSSGKCTGDGVICGENKKCVCHERLWFDGTQCVSALENDCNDVYAACAEIPHALCDVNSNKCVCSEFHSAALDPSISTAANAVCAAAQIGDHCLEAQECKSPNTDCLSERCVCKAGFVPQDDLTKGCVQSQTFLGDPCTNNRQCQVFDENAECDTNSKKCVCAEFYTANSLNDQCLPVILKIGDACSTKAQCDTVLGPDALCDGTSNTCVCRSSTVASADGNTCLPIQSLDAACLQDQQCSTDNEGAECVELKCACKKEYDIVDGKCFKLPAAIGDACTAPEQCDKFGEFAECDATEKKCLCVEGYVPNTPRDKCLKDVQQIGSQCEDSTQCGSISNSNCDILTHQCVCNSNHVPSADNTNCLPQTSGIFGECTDLGQCTAAVGGKVDCIDGKCLCKENCHYIPNACWDSQRLDEPCSDSRECLLAENTERAQCENSVCACKPGYQADRISNICNSGSLVTGSFATLSLLLIVTQKEKILGFF